MTNLDIPGLLGELSYRQNPYFLHDHLPHAAMVKSFWLALKNLRGAAEFSDIGLSVFSQNNEDGILLYIFSKIGFQSRKSIEIGCSVDNTTIGIPEGNSINLIVNFDFHGLIIDMEPLNVKRLEYFFSTCVTTRNYHSLNATDKKVPGKNAADKNKGEKSHLYSPILAQTRIDPENIDRIAEDNGFGGDIDLFSIDIDGNDVHVWEAVSAFSPRVLIIEVNNRLPFEQSVFTGPKFEDDLDKKTLAYWRSGGSSLTRIVSSAEARGYVFVGMNNNLINAFFVRKDAFRRSGLKAAKAADYFNHRLRPPGSREPLAGG